MATPASPFPAMPGDDLRGEATWWQARRHLEQNLVQVQGRVVGALAARHHPPAQGTANYGEVFIRDNVPVILHLLLHGGQQSVRHFLEVTLALQGQEPQNRGLFPISFVESDTGQLLADYGQRAIGRIGSVDSSLWWPILAWLYVRHSGDRQLLVQPELVQGVTALLERLLQPAFDPGALLHVGEGAFMVDRPLDVWGAPLEVQVLLHGCLQSALHLLRAADSARQVTPACAALMERAQQRQRSLGLELRQHYWLTPRRLEQWQRRPVEQYGDRQQLNPYNVQPEAIPVWLEEWLAPGCGYLIGNVRSGRADFRFFSLGNSLACLVGLLRPAQERALFRLVLHHRQQLLAQMPLRLCHPPLEGEAWRLLSGCDPRNKAWTYHNGGHWPSLFWFLAAAIRRHQRRHGRHDPALMAALDDLLEEGYGLQQQHLPHQGWPEYCDGPDGRNPGQQARREQSWTIAGFLLLHQLRRGDADAVTLLDLTEDDPAAA